MQIDTLTLRPDTAKAARWSVVSVVVIAFGAWLVADAVADADTWLLFGANVPASVAMWILFGLILAVAGWFLLQLVAPSLFELRIAPDGIHARTAWQHLDVPWEHVESAGIRIIAGEPYLRLQVIEEVAGGWVVRPTAVVLPLGADLPALRMALARARAVGRVGVEGVGPDA